MDRYAAAVEEAIHLLLDFGKEGKHMVRPVGLWLSYRPETADSHAALTIGHRDFFPSQRELHLVTAVLRQALPGAPRLVPKLKQIEAFGCAIFEWQHRRG